MFFLADYDNNNNKKHFGLFSDVITMGIDRNMICSALVMALVNNFETGVLLWC